MKRAHLRLAPRRVMRLAFLDIGSANLTFKFKPDNFDGSVPLCEFLPHFDLIARVNAWPDSMKTVALASSLREKACAVLDGIFELKNLKFEKLKSKLELQI